MAKRDQVRSSREAAQDLGEDGLEDLPPPSRLPPERQISGTREDAVEFGSKLGVDETYRRREDGEDADQRIRRAIAYAAWEYDGKPEGGAYPAEFGIKRSSLIDSFDRPEGKK